MLFSLLFSYWLKMIFFFIWRRFFIAHISILNVWMLVSIGRCYLWGEAMVFRRAGLSAIFGLSCIVKADFCLSCTVQGIWPWSVKVKIMLVVHHPFVVHRAKFAGRKIHKKSILRGASPPPPPPFLDPLPILKLTKQCNWLHDPILQLPWLGYLRLMLTEVI